MFFSRFSRRRFKMQSRKPLEELVYKHTTNKKIDEHVRRNEGQKKLECYRNNLVDLEENAENENLLAKIDFDMAENQTWKETKERIISSTSLVI